MNIRKINPTFRTNLSKDELKHLFCDEYEEINFPKVVSINACNAKLGQETTEEDSPLSFLLKFYASHISPPRKPTTVRGLPVNNDGDLNILKCDDKNKYFKSVEENHYNLTIKNDLDLEGLVKEMLTLTLHNYIYEIKAIRAYLETIIDCEEWGQVFKERTSWRKFRNKALLKIFESTHVSIEKSDLESYSIKNPLVKDDIKRLVRLEVLPESDKRMKLLKSFV